MDNRDEQQEEAAKPLARSTTEAVNQEASGDEFSALKTYSAAIGSDPRLVQGAGGNTSIKRADGMWIKASGTWLMNAEQPDQFVPVDTGTLLKAVDDQDPRAEKALDFVQQSLNPSGLRPSIETTVHALLPQRIVVHVHCVHTISHAVQQDAQQVLARKLAGFDWSFIPYVRPGLPLAGMIRQHMKPGSDVLVLGNHGLVVAAETVGEAGRLLEQVVSTLNRQARPVCEADIDSLNTMSSSGDYRLPPHPSTHGVALDSAAVAVAAGGSLYPDHVIFLGEGSVIAADNETLADVVARCTGDDGKPPVSIIFPARGVLMHESASPGQEALAQCLSDVCLRIPAGTAVHYLDHDENHELLNWEAEQYRQQLEKASAGQASKD